MIVAQPQSAVLQFNSGTNLFGEVLAYPPASSPFAAARGSAGGGRAPYDEQLAMTFVARSPRVQLAV